MYTFTSFDISSKLSFNQFSNKSVKLVNNCVKLINGYIESLACLFAFYFLNIFKSIFGFNDRCFLNLFVILDWYFLLSNIVQACVKRPIKAIILHGNFSINHWLCSQRV